MDNIKNTLTNIAGILGAIAFIGGTIIAYLQQSAIAVPNVVTIIVGVCGAVSVGILGYFSGKNPNGTVKTPEQVDAANKGIVPKP